jgi:C-terminal processing protease CtpA/Prc
LVEQEHDVVVGEIVPGFAAADSNQFDVGDVVLSIDNVKVSYMLLADVKRLTIGRAGSKVSLIMHSPTEVDTLHMLKT